MKNSTFKWMLAAVIVVAVGVAVSVYSCEKQQFTPNTAESVSDDPLKFITEPGAICGDFTKKMVGNTNERYVADAYLYNDTKYFYVIIAAAKGHFLGNAYLHVSEKQSDFPLDANQNVDISKYEYTIMPGKLSTLRKFRIPIEEINGYNYVSAAVEVSNEQTRVSTRVLSWVEGKYFGTDKPGKIFHYTKGICKTDEAQSDNETK